MFRIYDKINNYEYAKGNNVQALIDNWNKNAKNNFYWILENYQDENFYNQVVRKCYRIENIKEICRIVNNVEVNDLQLYQDKEVLDEI